MLELKKASQYTSAKVISLAQLARYIKKTKKDGRTVGVCHGGFDLLHPGHMKHFVTAKSMCDIVVVSVTADKFITDRKGMGRPIYSQTIRAYMIANIEAVTYVVISPWSGGERIIKYLKPSFYVKGPDFKHKQTPGIERERAAIEQIGGKMLYTSDEPTGTTELINYIKNNIPIYKLLILCDRDGTLIENDTFIGNTPSWRSDIVFNHELIATLAFLKTKYQCTILMVTNQSGVARRLFPLSRVHAINRTICKRLKQDGIVISDCLVAPHVDTTFANSNSHIHWHPRYVRATSGRKPSPALVQQWLSTRKQTISQYTATIVFGNSADDRGLAGNLHAYYQDVTGKSTKQLKTRVERYLTNVLTK